MDRKDNTKTIELMAKSESRLARNEYALEPTMTEIMRTEKRVPKGTSGDSVPYSIVTALYKAGAQTVIKMVVTVSNPNCIKPTSRIRI